VGGVKPVRVTNVVSSPLLAPVESSSTNAVVLPAENTTELASTQPSEPAAAAAASLNGGTEYGCDRCQVTFKSESRWKRHHAKHEYLSTKKLSAGIVESNRGSSESKGLKVKISFLKSKGSLSGGSQRQVEGGVSEARVMSQSPPVDIRHSSPPVNGDHVTTPSLTPNHVPTRVVSNTVRTSKKAKAKMGKMVEIAKKSKNVSRVQVFVFFKHQQFFIILFVFINVLLIFTI